MPQDEQDCFGMTSIVGQLKRDFFGYLTLMVLIAVLIGTHMVSLCIFFLFIYLFMDVFINDINRKFPAIPKPVLIVVFYILIIGLFVLLSMTVIPRFFKDLPSYIMLVKLNIFSFLNMITDRYEIPFTLANLKDTIINESGKSLGKFVAILNGISKGIVYFIVTLVLNLLLFLESKHIKQVFTTHRGSLLFYLFNFVVRRFTCFYLYFRKVMGGQVIISLINTTLTLVVVLLLDLPHKISLVSIVFLCGLLPVVGNLISNTVLSVTALVTDGMLAFSVCLMLLFVIHKLEYFLNGKIIGTIIRLPMFITVLSLLFGEAILGVWGMILAIPFVLVLKDELEGFNTVSSSQTTPELLHIKTSPAVGQNLPHTTEMKADTDYIVKG